MKRDSKLHHRNQLFYVDRIVPGDEIFLQARMEKEISSESRVIGFLG